MLLAGTLLGEDAKGAATINSSSKPDPWIITADTKIRRPELVSFELADQTGTLHTMVFPGPKPVLLCSADPRASKKLKDWTTPIGARLGGSLNILAVADLRTVAESFREMALQSIRDKRSEKVLLDWEGKVCAPRACRPYVPNLVLVGTNGTVLLHVASTASKSLVSDFLTATESRVQGGRSP